MCISGYGMWYWCVPVCFLSVPAMCLVCSTAVSTCVCVCLLRFRRVFGLWSPCRCWSFNVFCCGFGVFLVSGLLCAFCVLPVCSCCFSGVCQCGVDVFLCVLLWFRRVFWSLDYPPPFVFLCVLLCFCCFRLCLVFGVRACLRVFVPV